MYKAAEDEGEGLVPVIITAVLSRRFHLLNVWCCSFFKYFNVII